MTVGVSILLVIVILCRDSHQMWCLDGSDCAISNTCSLCEGAACLRVQRNHLNRVSIALTCLPHDTLIHTYYPEGCKRISLSEIACMCSHREFCNTSSRTTMPLSLLVLSSFIFLIL
ncbi:Activin_recp domain-containing protein [Caenorhabditis elegans]|uniref:Activin_recp domain-containing protein n=1 Tax=Caenorhabditis elegans TaxID=6239 RepID=Q7YX03_CAEEL|nr:Activin_recp domain-containing protein [Caenorhabditis elegans]CAE17846.1 Activin_recp domain-containing protein [Caenorhabditis elegans]|eukprot:NP_001023959.1 Uncharacterized protein CELE_F53B7.7 [Caenorhabditis elegans]